MAWRRLGDKPLSEPMLTRFIDAYAAQVGDDLIIRDATSTDVDSSLSRHTYIHAF